MLSKEYKSTAFKTLYVIAILSLIVFSINANNYRPAMAERKILMTLAYVPMGLVGIISLVNPKLALEALNAFKREGRQRNLKIQRLLGGTFILLMAVRLINVWL